MKIGSDPASRLDLSECARESIHGARAGEVRVGAAPADGFCELRIIDDGPGIAAEDMAHVFEPRWQGRQSDSAGAGPGLCIARGIVEAHGGTLRAQGAPDPGVRFAFALPLD